MKSCPSVASLHGSVVGHARSRPSAAGFSLQRPRARHDPTCLATDVHRDGFRNTHPPMPVNSTPAFASCMQNRPALDFPIVYQHMIHQYSVGRVHSCLLIGQAAAVDPCGLFTLLIGRWTFFLANQRLIGLACIFSFLLSETPFNKSNWRQHILVGKNQSDNYTLLYIHATFLFSFGIIPETHVYTLASPSRLSCIASVRIMRFFYTTSLQVRLFSFRNFTVVDDPYRFIKTDAWLLDVLPCTRSNF